MLKNNKLSLVYLNVSNQFLHLIYDSSPSKSLYHVAYSRMMYETVFNYVFMTDDFHLKSKTLLVLSLVFRFFCMGFNSE